ncbi:CAP domain-containing protein [Salimicrobium halophilum]|uniref:Cysteine-rich secretory protein family protein n=1 Tax=Salimicrobium halophilum TaxID=86666 RepID=A0A1G8U7Q9_9BACI|nr:CAP domain-containing protein [Salimicrobium halophilum]SDJ49767.1 Cysteine-rich secretory protein family protein [Salimicrobium halophilum]
MKRTIMALFILWTFFLITPVSAEDNLQVMEKDDTGLQWEYYREGGTPQGLITKTNPYITYYISVNANSGESFLLKMFLNGEEVEASYNPATDKLTYQAGELTGDNHVRVELHSGGKVEEWSWSFSIDESPVRPLEGADTEKLNRIQSEAVTTINSYRDDLSLPLLSSNDKLQQIAQGHSNYLEEHSEDGHTQRNPESDWFTGYQVGDRAKYFNYSGFIGEGIAFQEENSKDAIHRLFDAPYHRMSLIDPRFSQIGTGYNESGDFVANYGGSGVIQSPETVVYPSDNQQDVKLSWYAFEVPNPLRFYNKDAVWTGYPISFGYFGSPQDELQVAQATLKNEKGERVPVYDVLPSMEEEGNKTHAFLIPKEPLTPGMTYEVDVDASVSYSETESVDVSRSWSFTTASSLSIRSVHFEEQNGTTFLKEEWDSGVDPDAEIVLTKDGEEFMRKEAGSQTTSSKLETGNYQMTVTSPLFEETKVYDLTIRNDQDLSYQYDSPWVVTEFSPQEKEVEREALWSNFSDWSSAEKVASANKEWTIAFNQSMKEVDNINRYIYVIDESGQEIDVSVGWKGESQKEAVVSPTSDYEDGDYLLIIEPMEAATNQMMEDGLRMAFTVE